MALKLGVLGTIHLYVYGDDVIVKVNIALVYGQQNYSRYLNASTVRNEACLKYFFFLCSVPIRQALSTFGSRSTNVKCQINLHIFNYFLKVSYISNRRK